MKEKWREFFGFERSNEAASARDELALEEPFEEAEEPPLPIHLGLLFATTDVQREESVAVLEDAFGEKQDRTELVKYALGDIIFWLGQFTLWVDRHHLLIANGLGVIGSAILLGRATEQRGETMRGVYIGIICAGSFFILDFMVASANL